MAEGSPVDRLLPIALASLLAAACAGIPREPSPDEDLFMATFEATQAKAGEARGVTMLVSAPGDG